MRPSVPTYGSIIKAYANLKCPDKCWHYWNAARLSLPGCGGFVSPPLAVRFGSQEMQGQRGLEPNDIVYGCMLDALVCNGQVDEAVQLFDPGSEV